MRFVYRIGVDAYDAAGNRSAREHRRMDGRLSGRGTADGTVQCYGLVGHQLERHARMVAGDGQRRRVRVRIYRGGSRVSSVTDPTAARSGLTCGTSYTVRVDAADAAANRSCSPR